jgi:hypothetical protein
MNSHIKVNLSDGSFRIDGTEEFVEKHLEGLEGYIKTNINLSQQSHSIEKNSETHSQPTPKEQNNNDSKKQSDKQYYIKEGVFHIDPEDQTVTILKKVPGKNKAIKSRNVALIALYAKGEKMLASEIKALCEKQSCYDSNNFPTIFKKDVENFIRKNEGKSWKLELTINGEKAAKELLDNLIEKDKSA